MCVCDFLCGWVCLWMNLCKSHRDSLPSQLSDHFDPFHPFTNLCDEFFCINWALHIFLHKFVFLRYTYPSHAPKEVCNWGTSSMRWIRQEDMPSVYVSWHIFGLYVFNMVHVFITYVPKASVRLCRYPGIWGHVFRKLSLRLTCHLFLIIFPLETTQFYGATRYIHNV